jgi:tripartite-type tricarboxylate transporter receptor subunit TctC
MAATLFKSILKLPVEIIPYKSTAALFMGLQGKDVAVAFEVISPSLPLIKASSIRAIAVSILKTQS